LVLLRRHFISGAIAAPLLGTSLAPCLAQTAAAKTPASAARRILVVGDSLSAEYGLKRGTGWVALLEKRLASEHIAATVRNASISGDTTSGGRSRLPALLGAVHPTHVIIELGGNDALRGLPLAMTEENLAQMTRTAQQAGAKVLLVGMQIPPNYGADYGRRFSAAFENVAKASKAGLVPFFLKGVGDGADATAMFQADRIHPKEEAHPLMLDNVWPQLKKLL
jgi:acyl-CoA thioesterase-1